MFAKTPLLETLNIKLPILLAPMANAADAELAIAVSLAGGLGSIACATLSAEEISREVALFRENCPNSFINLNFFCHNQEPLSSKQEAPWKLKLKPYYKELGVDENQLTLGVQRKPFDEEMCALVEELKPEVISFHFGLPSETLLRRVQKTGCKILSTATTAAEATWLESNGCDAIIAQGLEAGGHRGMFLTTDISTQLDTATLVPLIVSAVKIPVIATGGIGSGKSLAAFLTLGASAAQIGTAYLFTPEAKISEVHRAALLSSQANETALTNIFSGKPARGIVNRIMKEIGPMVNEAPPFPYAGNALAPLKEIAEKNGCGGFSSLWAGQAASQQKEILAARDLTDRIAQEAMELIK